MAWDGSLSPPCIFKPPFAACGPAFKRMKCSVLLGAIKVWPKYNLVYFGMDEWGCLAAVWRVVCGGNGDPGCVLLVPGADGKVFCSRTNSFLFYQQVLALKVLKVWWSSGKGIHWRHVLALRLLSWTLGLLFPSQRPGSGCRTLEQLVLFSLCVFHCYQELREPGAILVLKELFPWKDSSGWKAGMAWSPQGMLGEGGPSAAIAHASSASRY